MDQLHIAAVTNYHNLSVLWFSHQVPSNSRNPTGCRPPGSSVHGISQARILQWVAVSFSRGSSWPRDQTHVSYNGRRSDYHWATTGKLSLWLKHILLLYSSGYQKSNMGPQAVFLQQDPVSFPSLDLMGHPYPLAHGLFSLPSELGA